VEYGDTSSKLGFRFTPNALCLTSGCPDEDSLSDSWIRQSSSIPTYDASLRLNNLGLTTNARRSGVPFSNVTIDGVSAFRATTIVSVDTGNPAGLYGVGELIEILVRPQMA
jgi:hypothetical protein